MIRVLTVEDSPTVRKVLVHALDQDPDIRVVGEAVDGIQAVEMTARLRPDLITMDVVMPNLDGLEATRRIMARHPTPILIITSHVDSPDLKIAFEAMQAGALDIVAKPDLFGPNQTEWEAGLIARVKNLAGVRPWDTGENQDGKG